MIPYIILRSLVHSVRLLVKVDLFREHDMTMNNHKAWSIFYDGMYHARFLEVV
jgi:hypothetical protein